MPSVTIDAGVLAAPPVEATSDQVLGYIETLLDWRQLLDEQWIPIYMSERAPEVLFADGLYPLYESLEHLFATRGIVEYAVNDIVIVVNALLQLTPSFEDYFELTDALATGFVTDPDLLDIRLPVNLAAGLERCVLLTAVLTCCVRSPADHVLIVRPWGGTTDVQVEAVIDYLEHSRDDVENLPTPPEYLRAHVATARNFRELMTIIDEVAVWQAAESDDAAKRAVQLAVYRSRLERGLDPDWETLPHFTLGRMFVETAQNWLKSQPGSSLDKLLKVMAATIDGLPEGDPHPLRTGEGGDNPQRTRNGDRAMRRQVVGQYRLHYWECEDGKIEFGSVGIHDIFTIPD